MGIVQLLRKAGIASRERRGSPRTRCRLHCTIVKGRKRIRARVLDVSESGLCILSPVAFPTKRPLLIQIDVPSRDPVVVEAVAWHVRKVRTASSGRKVWSIGMMISKAGPGFGALLPDGSDRSADVLASKMMADVLDSKLRELPPERPSPAEEDLAREDDSLSAAEFDHTDLELLPTAKRETESAQAKESTSDDALQLFRVRVKARTGPRTRTLTLGAVSAEEATALAESDLDEAWAILEVKPQRAMHGDGGSR